jgi:TolA-binding protein
VSRKNGNISGKKGQQESNSWADTDMMLNPGDQALFGKVSEYMRGCLDIEDVKSDPLFKDINVAAREMTSGFDHNDPMHKANARYISDNIAAENEDEKLADEINDIKKESRENDLGNITAGWVRKWDKERMNCITPDVLSEERKEFITNSLVEADNDYDRKAETDKKKLFRKTIFARFALPAAAAVIGAVFLVKLLLPSYNPDKLYAKYYEPVNAISPVTRSAGVVETNSYTAAVESYNSKNYQAAVIAFSDAILKDPLNMSPRFFMGITQMELGNYDQAENLLEDVISHQGEYTKEARWYLGLACIKTRNTEKARECFEILAKSPGFYSGRAEKILRRFR